MNLLIGIATYKRHNKLKKCIDSILNSTYKNLSIEVVADNNDISTIEFLHDNYDAKIIKLLQDKQSFVIGAWNRVVQENIGWRYWDGFIGLCDDVELYPHALKNIVETHMSAFPDTDGVCGFNQICEGHPNYNFKWFGQTLIGRRFIERYKEGNYQICCPSYKHFYQDEEMFLYANSLNKFVPCEFAILNHNHPSFTGDVDETHNIIRKGENSPLKIDTETFARRTFTNLLWGREFDL